ncbi:hypothetical protein ACPEEZ_10805 [Frigoribacterium sp. 2-23]|uniref:hypothetical protein n=1 Tax=Frigoribacterium sp. 2-23 TaxID=3415006 RepID=UPI003C6FD3B6
MSLRERTPQQIDPLGGLGARPITAAAAASSLIYAVVMAVVTWRFVVDPLIAVVSLLLLAAAGGVLVRASSPYRAPFTRRASVVMVGLGSAAAITSAVSMAGANEFVRDDWPPIAVGMLLLGLAPYRPGLEIALLGGLYSLVVAVVVTVESPFFTAVAPVPVLVIAGIVPVVALSLAGATFSATFVSLVERWMSRASTFRSASVVAMRSSIARSVQQDRVTILNRDVVPFFSRLLDADALTADDAGRARDIADALRRSMVAEADQSWLDAVLLSPGTAVTGVVVDDDHLAETMTADQRTSMRALLVALGESGVVRSDDVRVEVLPSVDRALDRGTAEVPRAGPGVDVLISVGTLESESVVRHRLAPYFAVLRIVFDTLQVDSTAPLLTVRFSYDQH